MSVVALESKELVLALHALLTDIDPARWRERMSQALGERLVSIEERLRALLASHPWDGQLEPLKARLLDMERVLRARAESLKVPSAGELGGQISGQIAKQWVTFRREARPAYEALAASLRQVAAVHVPSLRPTNYTRNLFHVTSALSVLTVIALVPVPMWLSVFSGAFALWAWSLETGRRFSPKLNAMLMKFFKPIAHPHEAHRVNSATWYMTALFLLSLSGSPMLCSVAVAVLGVGDPSAALIGRRWGKIKLVNGRSLEGTATFVTVGSLAAAACVLAWEPSMSAGATIALALAAGLGGALAELFSRRVDDNFSIPLAVLASTWTCLWVLSL